MNVDFRSDTVTKPTPSMLEAMMQAEVGDDVFGDDPTVNELETHAAKMFGKEAALFCPSGTMTNQVAIKVHTRPGDEVICDRFSHVYNYEGGGIAFNSGCSVRLLDGDRGRFTAADVEGAILPDDPHHPRPRLVVVENTCNKGGGSIWSGEEIRNIRRVCDKHGLRLHLDGARLFNALVETGENPAEAGEPFDSISICLSKGLGCPVGSLLIGRREFIREGRRVRKVFGGGMRQAGYLAAAGLHALKNHVERLREDHARARELSVALENQGWVENVLEASTNIVVAELVASAAPSDVLVSLEKSGIRAVPFGKRHIRFVTHMDVSDGMLAYTIDALPRIG